MKLNILWLLLIFLSCNDESINGIYEIRRASSLLYGQPMEIVESSKIGNKISIKNNTVIFDDFEFSINENYKDFRRSMIDNKISLRDFYYFWQSMNYNTFDMTIIDPNFDNSTFYSARDSINFPKDVIVRLIKNNEIEYMIFFIDNKLIIEISTWDWVNNKGIETEFEHLIRHERYDNFFYIAEKIIK